MDKSQEQNLIFAKLPVNYYDRTGHNSSYIEQLIRVSAPESTIIYLDSAESENSEDGFIMRSVDMSNFKYNKIKLASIVINMDLKTINDNCNTLSLTFTNATLNVTHVIKLTNGYYNLSSYRTELLSKLNALPNLSIHFTPINGLDFFEIEIIDSIRLKLIPPRHKSTEPEPIKIVFNDCNNLRCKKLCYFKIGSVFMSNDQLPSTSKTSFITSDLAFMIYTHYLTIESKELCKIQRNPNILNNQVNYNLISMITLSKSKALSSALNDEIIVNNAISINTRGLKLDYLKINIYDQYRNDLPFGYSVNGISENQITLTFIASD